MFTRCTLIVALTFLAAPTEAWGEKDLSLSGLGPVERALLAQSDEPGGGDEPTAPGGTAPPAPGSQPTTGTGEEPGGTSSEEPGGTSTEEPGGGTSTEEPGGDKGEPGKPAEGDPTPTVVAKPKAKAIYGAGFHIRGLFVPTWFLGMFFDQSTSLNSVGFGGEFVRRKGNFDIVASMNFGFYSPADGNYLGNGKAPEVDTDYLQFRNLNMLAFDVAFIGHHDFLPWLSLVYGAGLGFGIVLGDIYRISAYQGNCHADNLGNFGECNPVNPADTTSLKNWNEDRDGWLADGCHQDDKDSPNAPCQYREPDVWPVIPVVHLLLGVNFKVNEQFSVRVDGGFHNAFYFGAAGHYFF